MSRRVEYVPLTKIQGAAVNPKEHDLGEIITSIKRRGFVELPAIDGRTGRLVAGHGRIEALNALKKDGAALPEGLREEGGEWLVPVLHGWASKSDADAAAYLVASNRLVESGGWDQDALDQMVLAIAKDGAELLEGTGYDGDDVDRIVREMGHADAEPPFVVPLTSSVQRGDLFVLGDHRLLCGDSTVDADVLCVMDGQRAGLVNTDPPYGVSYANNTRPKERGRKPRSVMPVIEGDGVDADGLSELLESAFRRCAANAVKPDAAWYVWHSDAMHCVVAAAAAKVGVAPHRSIIWVKSQLVIGRGQYHSKHESCFFGFAERPPDYGEGNGERTQTTVWEVESVDRQERLDLKHATPKPVRLFEIPIVKHLKRGEICFEPFAGSGPQFIAAEKTGRRCFGIELEPIHVETIVRRWEAFTGRKAEKVST